MRDPEATLRLYRAAVDALDPESRAEFLRALGQVAERKHRALLHPSPGAEPTEHANEPKGDV